MGVHSDLKLIMAWISFKTIMIRHNIVDDRLVVVRSLAQTTNLPIPSSGLLDELQDLLEAPKNVSAYPCGLAHGR